MIIFLARHGQTTGDVEGRYGGDYDDALTALGKQQSAQLGEQLANKNIEQLYASPRIRAQETATIIAGQLGLTIKTRQDFRERNAYGVLTGMTKKEATDKYPEQVELLVDKDRHNKIQNAEKFEPFQRRITAAFENLCAEPVSRLAIISHGGPIRFIFREILNLGEITIDDCAYAAIEVSGPDCKVLETSGITIKS